MILRPPWATYQEYVSKGKKVKMGRMELSSRAHLVCMWPWVQTPINMEKQRKEKEGGDLDRKKREVLCSIFSFQLQKQKQEKQNKTTTPLSQSLGESGK